jgi:predicted secreted protein
VAKYSSFGTLFQIGDGGSPETFTTVAGVQDISGPGFETETIDVTAHDSPGAFEELVAGIKRSGDITFDLVYDPAHATHDDTDGLFSFWQDREVHNYKVVFTDAGPTTMSFAGICTGFEFSMPVSGALAASCTIKPTGEPTFA